MGSLNVRFIDKDYNIPEDVLLYIELLKITDNVKEQLYRSFLRLISRSENGFIDDSDMTSYINGQTNRFITMLCDNGIYNRTMNDYLKNNKGYQLISKVNKAALNEAKRVLKQQMSDWLQGYESAVQKKDSSVTGLGFSIWSGSFVNHAIYAAMEASKVNAQEKAAAQEYQRDMAELDARLESRKSEEEKRYIANTYVPNMETAITVFAYELLDTYISDLIANNKIDKTTLNFINIQRSNELLDNLNLSNNKKAVLENAFLACPYNAAVYMGAMRHDLLDIETFQTAKTFKCDNTIISFLESHWGKVSYPNKFDINYHCIDLLALYTERNSKDILRDYTKSYANSVAEAYSKIAKIYTNEELCSKAVRKLSDNELLSGSAISSDLAKSHVHSIVSDSVWQKLIELCGHQDLFDKIQKYKPENVDVVTKKDIDDFYINLLTNEFEKSRQKLIPIIENKIKEEKRQKEAEAEKAQLIAERNKKLKKISFVAAIVVIVIAIVSVIITKANNAIAYKKMAGEFCVYNVINNSGKEKDEFNWWLSINEDGTIKMSSWSYAIDNTTVNSYSGRLKNKSDFKKFKDYHIEDYCADASEYNEAVYCYEFHVADEWDEFDGYVVCWQYHNGKVVDVYCDDYRYSFVETSDDYDFNKWEGEINSNKLSKNVQKLIDNINVSEEDKIEEIKNLISNGNYDKAIEAIVESKLSDEQKNAYYDSLVEKTDFKSFNVNGLVCNIPECWYAETKSDQDSVSVQYYPEKDSLFSWYVSCKGTVDQVVRDENDSWARDENYSPTTIDGCSEAYIRHESKETIKNESYSTTEYYVVCQGFVFEIQYFAYDERYFESEMKMLLEHIEFDGYSDEKIQAKRKSETYKNAVAMLENKEYEDAIVLFEQLGNYKDSKELIDTAESLQLQQIEDYKASCVEIDDLPSGSNGKVKVYVQIKSHILNDDYYAVTKEGITIKIWNHSDREELLEGEWITVYGYAYGLGENMTIDVEYIDD